MKSLRSIIVVLVSMLPLSTYAQSKEVEYRARRAATIQAMDSVLKYAQIDPGTLMKYADDKCEAFKNDTLLMNRIAEAFSTCGGYHDQAIERFRELKRVHPKYMDGYLNYAYTMHGVGTKVDNGNLVLNPFYRELAKAQIDSAKVVFPNSRIPYERWLSMCARYCFSKEVQLDFEKEVNAYNKAFPQANAYYVAGEILQNTEPDLSQFNNDERSSYNLALLNFGRKFYDTSNPQVMTLGQINNLSLHYFRSFRPSNPDNVNEELLERGVQLAQTGIERFPSHLNFFRLLLYDYSELASLEQTDQTQKTFYWNEAIKAGNTLFSKTDTLLGEDYFYYALASQTLSDYSSAVEYYQKALGKGLKQRFFNRDTLALYSNIAECYYGIKNYEKAIESREDRLSKRSQQRNFSLNRNDLSRIGDFYRFWGNDTTQENEERIMAYSKCISTYSIIQDSIDAEVKGFEERPQYRGYYTFWKLHCMFRLNQLETGSDYTEQIQKLIEQVIQRIDPLSEKSEREESYIGNACKIKIQYFRQKKDKTTKDYQMVIKYIDMLMRYDLDSYNQLKATFEDWRKKAKR